MRTQVSRFCAVFILALVASAAEGKTVKVAKEGKCEASVGDTVQFAFRFAVIPAKIIETLEVTINGKAAKKPTIKNTGDPNTVGSGEISYVVTTTRKGTHKIKVTPILMNGKKGEPREYELTVK